MRITSVKAAPLSLPMTWTYKGPLMITNVLNTVVVMIKTDEGIVGIGESCPGQPLEIGLTVGGALDVINNIVADIIVGENPFSINRVNEKIDTRIYGNYTVATCKAGVDMALYDIVGKALNVPVVELIGGRVRDKIPSELLQCGYGTMGRPEVVAENFSRWVKETGTRVIKLKIGGCRWPGGRWPMPLNTENDIETVKAVREALGDKITIDVDVNQGYGPSTAIKTIRKMADYIDYVEQPVLQDDIEGLARVAKSVDVPIMADEAVYTAEGLTKVIRTGVIENYNMKPSRAGGISGAMRNVRIVEGAGFRCQSDSVLESPIGACAITHVASAIRESTILWTTGGFTSVRMDSIVKRGGVKIENGCHRLPDLPGLGIELRDEVLEEIESYQFPKIVKPEHIAKYDYEMGYTKRR